MKYFSGFGFKNEKVLFLSYLQRGDFVVAGFSRGAQKAVQEALAMIEQGKRVDTLQLLSPAFFNYLSKEQKHKEILTFVKNKDAYLHFFYKKVLYPAKIDVDRFKTEASLGELKELLLYEWKQEDLELLQESGVAIEVYLGAQDKIVNADKAKEFFTPFAQVYLINNAGHLLR
ncbi:hypothetical protein NitYY0826_C1327 [Nitratiruptor sp. YY08-26]|uniref:pimelyl-ACP methyl ester esterase BioV n=1 Tax=unclassified Nitratiruptor TaxID=2624044 RepID=UPI0019151A4D|nr:MULTISPECIES: pimelyl-ACP methyl ester esterase BioV [unclassified Nitratiruptor]BCD62451.1 hypothetical protein NitYY0813_C1325 [Nitratiruptor sp. YY08-13]BCD66387.1 hypothetical protein NitYY0826_C1327 [Nitratiruptor sp. YY08-26]